MRVDDDTLDVSEIGIVLQRTHIQARLLAQLCNARAVVMRQRAVGHDGVRNLRVGHKVDLQQLQCNMNQMAAGHNVL